MLKNTKAYFKSTSTNAGSVTNSAKIGSKEVFSLDILSSCLFSGKKESSTYKFIGQILVLPASISILENGTSTKNNEESNERTNKPDFFF